MHPTTTFGCWAAPAAQDMGVHADPAAVLMWMSLRVEVLWATGLDEAAVAGVALEGPWSLRALRGPEGVSLLALADCLEPAFSDTAGRGDALVRLGARGLWVSPHAGHLTVELATRLPFATEPQVASPPFAVGAGAAPQLWCGAGVTVESWTAAAHPSAELPRVPAFARVAAPH